MKHRVERYMSRIRQPAALSILRFSTDDFAMAITWTMIEGIYHPVRREIGVSTDGINSNIIHARVIKEIFSME